MPPKKTAAKKAAKKKAAAPSPDAPVGLAATLKVERLPLASFVPHPRNPRAHPEPDSPEWKVLAASLAHDYFDPIVWNVRNGMLVSGHLRTKVLTSLGYTHADAVVVDYDEPTHIARMIAANKSIGENDAPKLAELFGELKGLGNFDSGLSGFTLPEIETALADFPQYQGGPNSGEPGEGGEDAEGTHGSPGGMSPEEIDARIKYLTAAIGNPTYPISAGQVAVIDKSVAILCGIPADGLAAALTRWIALPDAEARKALGGDAGAARDCRVLYGPDALLLVENGPAQLAAGCRWVVICPTIQSATVLLAVYKAHYKAAAKVKVIGAPADS